MAASRKPFSDVLWRPGEPQEATQKILTPKEMTERLFYLEKLVANPSVEALPIAALGRKLEQVWLPDPSTLLPNGGIRTNSLAPVPAFGASQSATIAGRFINGAWTKMGVDTQEYDTVGGLNLANDDYTIREAGLYLFSAAAFISAPFTAANAAAMALYVNGAERKRMTTTSTQANAGMIFVGATQAPLNLADVVDIRLLQTTGANRDQAIFGPGNYIHGVRVTAL